jgi:hypothetical protein
LGVRPVTELEAIFGESNCLELAGILPAICVVI